MAVLPSDAFAQSLSKSKSHEGRFEYSVTFKLKNTAATAICELEIQVVSPSDDIYGKIAPSGWNSTGPQNNAVAWDANAGNCIAGGKTLAGFGLLLNGVLPVDLHVCFADANGDLIGLCQAIRVK
jgi:hypothetical protein